MNSTSGEGLSSSGEDLSTGVVHPHEVDALDLGALRLLLAVAEFGSVAQAAHRVGLSQPSATVKLRKLERLVGVPTLNRTATGSKLTDAGTLVANAAQVALLAASEVFRAAERGRDGNTRLAIGATVGITELRLDRMLESVGLTDVVLDIVQAPTRGVAAAVRNGRVGLGFVDGPFAPLGLRSVEVGQFTLTAVGHPDHPLVVRLGGEPVTPEDVLNAGLLVARQGSGTRDVIEAAFAPFGFGVIGRLIEVDNTVGAVASMSTGRGIAFVPTERVEGLRQRGVADVIPLTLEIHQPIRACWTGTYPTHRIAAEIVRAIASGQ